MYQVVHFYKPEGNQRKLDESNVGIHGSQRFSLLFRQDRKKKQLHGEERYSIRRLHLVQLDPS